MSDAKEEHPLLCSSCGSDSIFGPLHLYPETVWERARYWSRRRGPPKSSGKVRSVPLRAFACRQFGNVQLIAADSEALFEHWSVERGEE